MTIRIQTDVTLKGVRHRYFPGPTAFGTIEFGEGGNRLYFGETADIDTVIAELVALRAEMAPPVITCSERTCDAKHPDTGDWCVIEGPHAEHSDTYGQTWPTAAAVLAESIATGTSVLVTEETKPVPSPTGECEAHSPKPGYVCTLDAGHDGRHEGGGAIPLPVWSDGDTEVEYVSDEAASVPA